MARYLSPSASRLLLSPFLGGVRCLLQRSIFSVADSEDTVCPSPSSSSPSSSSSKARQKKLSHRIASVVDAVNERKLPQELRGRPNAIRSETDIENVVEQRVWRSMEEGQFENLPGKGKPLKLSTNPHVDPAEDTLYRILSRNGCAPEWVELNKEIRNMIKAWRSAMKKSWSKRLNDDDPEWLEERSLLKKRMSEINSKKYKGNSKIRNMRYS